MVQEGYRFPDDKVAPLMRKLFLAVVAALLAVPAAGVEITFRKIVDDRTPLPGSPQSPEDRELYAPSIAGGTVVFHTGFALYAATGAGFQKLAGHGTPAPGLPTTFTVVGEGSPAVGAVAFRGSRQVGDGQDWVGAFLWRNGQVENVFDSRAPYPGHEVRALFGRVKTDGENLAFPITVSFQQLNPFGIYKIAPGGPLRTVVDRETRVPNSLETFYYLSDFDMSQGSVAFWGATGTGRRAGIFADFDGQLRSLVAEDETRVPGEPGGPTFDVVTEPDLDGRRLAFTGAWEDEEGTPQHGVFVLDGSSLHRVADTATLAPGSGETFARVGVPTLDGAIVAFDGDTSAGRGIYAEVGGELIKIVSEGDLLGGQAIDELRLWFRMLSGRDVVFAARTADGKWAIWAATIGPLCTPGPTTLCLQGGRFHVEARWRDFAGREGPGRTVPVTGESGFFWFFDEGNVELFVKVLDACVGYGRFWVFSSGLSTVAYDLVVTDTQTGQVYTVQNDLGYPGPAVAATDSIFRECGFGAGEHLPRIQTRRTSGSPSRPATIIESVEPSAVAPCVGSEHTLCMQGGRFAVEADWHDSRGSSGTAALTPLGSSSGYATFFSSANIELFFKVLDACAHPARNHWVFAAGLTDLGVSLRITDTLTGKRYEVRNAPGRLFPLVLDSGTFFTDCPP